MTHLPIGEKVDLQQALRRGIGIPEVRVIELREPVPEQVQLDELLVAAAARARSRLWKSTLDCSLYVDIIVKPCPPASLCTGVVEGAGVVGTVGMSVVDVEAEDGAAEDEGNKERGVDKSDVASVMKLRAMGDEIEDHVALEVVSWTWRQKRRMLAPDQL